MKLAVISSNVSSRRLWYRRWEHCKFLLPNIRRNSTLQNLEREHTKYSNIRKVIFIVSNVRK